MNSILLDTHVLVWYVNGSEELSKPLQKLITQALEQGQAYVAAISLWEIAMLDKKQRIILTIPCLEWIKKSLEITGLGVVPLTPSIAVESCQLPGTFHGDPADRMITATARVEGLTLLTRDKHILTYSRSKYISALCAS
jgi:PIN domain nuclease of toxin-antitoxin system